MRFFTPTQWQAWCVERQVPLRKEDKRPDLSADYFHIVNVPYVIDSGAKVSLARFFYSVVAHESETLILLDDWGVWPSSQHMPLFNRFREALGERRPLIEAPGHLITSSDSDDGISIIATSLLFAWDCYGISSSGRDAFYISHDELCFYASRDASIASRVEEQLNLK
jgi:hypothetical protein